MGLFSKLSYASKAKAIAKKHGLSYELPEMGVESINQKAMKNRENTELFRDLLLYNFYKNPCAYTANNVMALYVDVFNGLKTDVPGYEFFTSVGKYLEQASKIEEIFESKEYYLNLANYELISDKRDVQKAFDVLVSIKPECVDSDSQYMTGCLYYILKMPDMAKKVLEVSLEDMNDMQKASANCILALMYLDEGKTVEAKESAKMSVHSTLPAVVTLSCKVLNELGAYDVVINSLNEERFESLKNVRLFYEWVYALKKCSKSIDVCDQLVEEDILYSKAKEWANEDERVDIDMMIRDVNQEIMDSIASSEMYEYADDTTKRMLNNQIMDAATTGEDYEQRDLVVFAPYYLE